MWKEHFKSRFKSLNIKAIYIDRSILSETHEEKKNDVNLNQAYILSAVELFSNATKF